MSENVLNFVPNIELLLPLKSRHKTKEKISQKKTNENF